MRAQRLGLLFILFLRHPSNKTDLFLRKIQKFRKNSGKMAEKRQSKENRVVSKKEEEVKELDEFDAMFAELETKNANLLKPSVVKIPGMSPEELAESQRHVKASCRRIKAEAQRQLENSKDRPMGVWYWEEYKAMM